MRAGRAPLAILLPLVFAASSAMAEGSTGVPMSVPVRIGDHAGYGRVVFDFPHPTAYRLERDGAQVVLHFTDQTPIANAARLPRNVAQLSTAPGEATLQVAAGAAVHVMRLGDRIAIDVSDPPAPASAPPLSSASASLAAPHVAASRLAEAVASPRHGLRPRTAPPTPAPPQPPAPQPAAAVPAHPAREPAMQPAATPLSPVSPSPFSPAPRAAVQQSTLAAPPALATPQVPPPSAPALPAPPEVAADSTVAIAARKLTLPPGVPGAVIVLPFSRTTAAGAFRLRDDAVLVFDESRPIDLSALQADPVFGSAAVHPLANATVVRMKLPADRMLRLRPVRDGWMVSAEPASAPAAQPIVASSDPHGVLMPATTPGQVVTIDDPDSGAPLLVGTQRASGQAVAVARHAPEFDLLPTWQGVLVAPHADRLALRTVPGGFLLQWSEPGAAALTLAPMPAGALALANAANLTRRFDFPDLPTPALLRRLQAEIGSAATLPSRARGPAERQTAAVLIALGLGAEAQAVTELAAAQNPRMADDPDGIGLGAIAALLAGRLDQAGGLADPRLTGTDDVTLWRAVAVAMRQEGSPAAAAAIATELPLLLTYPAALRARLLPLAAETLVLGGQLQPAAALLASRPDDPSLALARGLLAQMQGHAPAALAIYDALARSKDRLLSTRAAVRADELRLAIKALSPAQTADAEERLLFAWRGDQREIALRLRIAALRAEAGQWRPALAMLRETRASFPEQSAAITAKLNETFAALMRDEQLDHLAPIDLVALVQENPDLLPDGAAGEAMAAKEASRLAALDLPQQAEPILEKLLQAAPSATARAAIGARLAALRLEDGEPAAALAALAASAADDLSAPLVEQRSLLLARATATTGDVAKAAATLAALGTPAADRARADILEAAKDWPAAEAALARCLAESVTGTGPLDEAQARLLLRLASASAQAGDESGLAGLREQFATRLPPGPLAQTFGVLTAEPVAAVSDLPRAAREMKAVEDLPAALAKIGASIAAN